LIEISLDEEELEAKEKSEPKMDEEEPSSWSRSFRRRTKSKRTLIPTRSWMTHVTLSMIPLRIIKLDLTYQLF